MLKKKSSSSSKEKKRKHSQPEEQNVNRKRRGTESSVELDSKDDLADAELDKIGSDIEEGGLDLSVPFLPISAYVSDRREILQQCFNVLGEKKLQKMLPDELKSCSLEEIQKLCWEQLEQVSPRNLLQILGGEELTSEDADDDDTETLPESQQDNNVDSTSSLKETKPEDAKQEAGGSGEESDVLSINADTYDSDMEEHKEKPAAKTPGGATATPAAAVVTPVTAKPAAVINPPAYPVKEVPPAATVVVPPPPPETKKDLETDIDRSVSEILAASSGAGKEAKEEAEAAVPEAPAAEPPAQGSGGGGGGGTVPASSSSCPPSVQQLELLELEMRARAIKALMKASDAKKDK